MTTYPDPHLGDQLDVLMSGDSGTAGTAAVSHAVGVVTGSVNATVAALSDYTLTLNSPLISADSIILASTAGAGTGTPAIGQITPGAGTATIKVHNLHATVPFNAPLVVSYAILSGVVNA